MAIHVLVKTRIERSIGDVFDEVTDIVRWPEWLIASGIRQVERTASGPIVAGERARIRQDAAGRSGTFDVAVTAFERPSILSIGGRDESGVTIDIDAELAAIGDETRDGATDLRWSIRIGLPLRYRILESMATPQVQRAAALDLEALKRRMEAHSPG
jgi:uncharacterized protein YndB with AHSA1/START domain